MKDGQTLRALKVISGKDEMYILGMAMHSERPQGQSMKKGYLFVDMNYFLDDPDEDTSKEYPPLRLYQWVRNFGQSPFWSPRSASGFQDIPLDVEPSQLPVIGVTNAIPEAFRNIPLRDALGKQHMCFRRNLYREVVGVLYTLRSGLPLRIDTYFETER
jgi:hypothetical protein